MEKRMRLTYEPKILLDIALPDGKKTELFIRGNSYEGDVLSRLGFPKCRLYLENAPLEQGKSLKELGITHHTVLEVRGGKTYKRWCDICGVIISALSLEELQIDVGIHIGETGHRRFTKVD